jgi:hypothetical protein
MNATLPTKASAAACAILLSVAPPRADAQSAASLALTGGVATDQRGVQSSALTVAPELRFEGPRASLHLGGSATRYQTDIWSLGGGAAFASREQLGSHSALTLNASASMSRLGGSFDASFREVAVLPAVQLTFARLTLFGGGRAAFGSSTTPSSVTQSGFLFPGAGSSASSVSHGGAGPVFGGTLALTETGAARIGAREDRLIVSRAAIVDRSVSLDAAEGRLRLGLVAGKRWSADENTGFGSATASIDVTPSASLDVAIGRYPSNRLLETPAGRFFSAGVSFRTGGAPAEPRLPRPSGAREVPRGMTRLALRAPDATRVDVAGDFNNWRLTPATRSANGVWYVDLRIAPGQYRYAFRVDGREWRVPDGATAVNDGFGGKSAWITVRDTPVR